MTIEATSIWIISGLMLIIGEMLSAGFFLLFIALGCFAAALVASLGHPFAYQCSTCAVFSIVGVLTLRKPIQKKLLQSIEISVDLGKEILVDQSIPPHHQVRISYQGTTWLATNLDSESLNPGERAIIVGIDGNVLLIRKVH